MHDLMATEAVLVRSAVIDVLNTHGNLLSETIEEMKDE